MKNISFRELYGLLEKGLKEEVQFSAKIKVENNSGLLFTYGGRVSLLPIANTDKKYDLRCHEGNALFRFGQRENAEMRYVADESILMPLDLDDRTFMKIINPGEIKY